MKARKLKEEAVTRNIEKYYKDLDRKFSSSGDASVALKTNVVDSDNSNGGSNGDSQPLVKIFHSHKSNEHTKDEESEKDESKGARSVRDDEFEHGKKVVKEGEKMLGQDEHGNPIVIPAGAVIFNRSPYDTDTNQSHESCISSEDEYEWDSLRHPTAEEFITMMETGTFNHPNMINTLTRRNTVNEEKSEGGDDEDRAADHRDLGHRHETTVREAREFVSANWGPTAARRKFPFSSEDNEVISTSQLKKNTT